MDYKKIKNFYSRFVSGANSIDKLMSDKLDDYLIVEDLPLPVKIGAKTIFIGNLTRQTYRNFLRKYAECMSLLGCEKLNIMMLSDHNELKKFLIIDSQLEKRFIKIIKEIVLKEQDYYIRLVSCDGMIKLKLPKVS